jgi:hypothetical protein
MSRDLLHFWFLISLHLIPLSFYCDTNLFNNFSLGGPEWNQKLSFKSLRSSPFRQRKSLLRHL